MVNIMLNNCNHYAPIEIAMVYPLLRHTQISYQVGELYNIYIYTTYSLFADDCPIISHYKLQTSFYYGV